MKLLLKLLPTLLIVYKVSLADSSNINHAIQSVTSIENLVSNKIGLVEYPKCGKIGNNNDSLLKRSLANNNPIKASCDPKDPKSLSSGIGFYSKENSSCIPEKVKLASQSVFEQRILSASFDESVMIIDVTNPEVENFKNKIKSIEPSLDFDELDKIVMLKQIERCENDESLEVRQNCFITTEIRKSTGFIAGSDLTLWTNAHAIEGFVDAIKKYEGKSIQEMKDSKQPLRIFLFDQDGNLVLNPYENEIIIDQLPSRSYISEFRKTYYSEDTDFVKLKLSKSIAKPIKLASQPPKNKQQLYLAGYSACTGCEPMSIGADPIDFSDRGEGLNSDGYGIKFTTGFTQNGDQLWESFFGLSKESLKLWNLDNMLFYTADSQNGNSGGPILNAKGEAVGIHAGGATKLEGDTLKRVSRGVLFPSSD